MSTLKADLLTHPSGGRPPVFAKGDTVKAWLSIITNAGPITFKGSANFSSIGDAAVGSYVPVFTALMVNGGYNGAPGFHLMGTVYGNGTQFHTQTSTNFGYNTAENATYVDSDDVNITICGALA